MQRLTAKPIYFCTSKIWRHGEANFEIKIAFVGLAGDRGSIGLSFADVQVQDISPHLTKYVYKISGYPRITLTLRPPNYFIKRS